MRVTDCQLHSDRVALTLATPLGPIAAEIPAPGEHVRAQRPDGGQPGDCPGRVGGGDCLSLSQFAGAPGRLQRKLRADGVLVLDDTYNAKRTPCAPRCACWRRSRGAPRRAGRYRRIGRWRPAMHAEVGAFARELGIDSLHGLAS